MNLLLTIVAFLLWFVLIACAFGSESPKNKFFNFNTRLKIFMIFAFAALLLFRLPTLTSNIELNVDESQMIAQTMKYLDNPIPWLSVDGTTNGPLNTYILMWPSLFGESASYTSIRFTGVILLFISILLGERSLRNIIGNKWSLAIILLPTTFYVFTCEADLLSYSSELLSLSLLNAMILAGFVLVEKPSFSRAAVIGLIAGAISMAKLQALPIAFAIFMLTMLVVWKRFHNPETRPKKLPVFLTAAGCCFVVPLLILTPVTMAGAWPDFIRRYILSNLSYGNPTGNLRLFTFASILRESPVFLTFFLGTVTATLVAFSWSFLFETLNTPKKYYWMRLFSATTLLAMAFFSVLKSNFVFCHYFHYLVFPLVILLAVSLTPVENAIQREQRENGWRNMAKIQVLAICLLPMLGNGLVSKYSLFYTLAETVKPVANPAVDFLRKNSHPGDRVAIWGWTPEIYVRSGLTPATRNVVCDHAFIEKGSLKSYYSQTFVNDLQKSKPRFILDTVRLNNASEWPINEILAMSDPFMKAYIDRDYIICYTIYNQQKEPVIFIYKRKDSFH